MNNQILIVCNDLNDGEALLRNISGETKIKDINYFTIGYAGATVELKNGDVYIVMKPAEGLKGHKIEKAYVHRDVHKYFVDNIINPLFVDGVDIVYF